MIYVVFGIVVSINPRSPGDKDHPRKLRSWGGPVLPEYGHAIFTIFGGPKNDESIDAHCYPVIIDPVKRK
jgi:hypothetical protein